MIINQRNTRQPSFSANTRPCFNVGHHWRSNRQRVSVVFSTNYQCVSQQTQNICITLIQGWANVKDVGPRLYKCYTDILCLLCRGECQLCQTAVPHDNLIRTATINTVYAYELLAFVGPW